MEETIQRIRAYMERAREALFEITRDPYMALVDCEFIRRSLGRDDSLFESAKKGIEKELRQVERQASFDLVRYGFLGHN